VFLNQKKYSDERVGVVNLRGLILEARDSEIVNAMVFEGCVL
jgi:hypothetical protein